ncbi:MAG: hypothetical protein IJL32_09375 [Oscillospiraceae bacterium]|nr:hypothetical protein [Oscillospiraceae bacterium]
MVDESQMGFMTHSYQEIDAAVDQAETNRQAIASMQTSKADTSALTAEQTTRATADNKLIAALTQLIDVDGAVQKNLISVNSGTTPSANGYFCENLPISMPAGSYHVSMERADEGQLTFVIKAADNTELARWSRASGVTSVSEDITISADGAKISVYVGNNVTVSDAMVCAKAYYDISPAFVPYASNRSVTTAETQQEESQEEQR